MTPQVPEYFRRMASLNGYNEREQNRALTDYLKTGGQNLNPAETAWCAGVVNASLEQTGIKGTGSLAARSFLKWGQPTEQPRIGDIAVFSRGSNPAQGHVGLFSGLNPDGTIKVLGGNQGDAVSYASYPASRLLGYRTPAQQALEGGASSVVPVDPRMAGGMNAGLPVPAVAPQSLPQRPDPMLFAPTQGDPQDFHTYGLGNYGPGSYRTQGNSILDGIMTDPLIQMGLGMMSVTGGNPMANIAQGAQMGLNSATMAMRAQALFENTLGDAEEKRNEREAKRKLIASLTAAGQTDAAEAIAAGASPADVMRQLEARRQALLAPPQVEAINGRSAQWDPATQSWVQPSGVTWDPKADMPSSVREYEYLKAQYPNMPDAELRQLAFGKASQINIGGEMKIPSGYMPAPGNPTGAVIPIPGTEEDLKRQAKETTYNAAQDAADQLKAKIAEHGEGLGVPKQVKMEMGQLNNELLTAIAAASNAGVLQEGEAERLSAMIPDPSKNFTLADKDAMIGALDYLKGRMAKRAGKAPVGTTPPVNPNDRLGLGISGGF